MIIVQCCQVAMQADIQSLDLDSERGTATMAYRCNICKRVILIEHMKGVDIVRL